MEKLLTKQIEDFQQAFKKHIQNQMPRDRDDFDSKINDLFIDKARTVTFELDRMEMDL